MVILIGRILRIRVICVWMVARRGYRRVGVEDATGSVRNNAVMQCYVIMAGKCGIGNRWDVKSR